MIVKHLDLRERGSLRAFLSEEEKQDCYYYSLLDVYFLIEKTKKTAYHKTTIIVRTKKCLYISSRDSFSFESGESGRENLIRALENIFEADPEFNSFHFWCADNKDLDELEDITLIEYNKTHLPKSECEKEFNVTPVEFAKNVFLELKDIALKRVEENKKRINDDILDIIEKV